MFQLIDRLIPSQERNLSEESLRNGRIVYSAAFLMMINDLLFGTLGVMQGDRVIPWIVLGMFPLACLTPILHRMTRSSRFAAAWIALLATVLLVSTGALSGGMHSTSRVWFAALAVFILLTLGTRAALIWIFAIACECLALWWLSAHGVSLPDYENPSSKAISWALSFPSGLLLIVALLQSFLEAHRRAMRNLDKQARDLELQAVRLEKAKAEAEAGSRARSDFIATVSHEIRTPMNGILGMSHLLFNTELSDEQKKFLGALKISAEGLLSILGDILDFSKIEAGKLQVRPEVFALRGLCEESLSVFAGVAQSKGLGIRLLWGSGLPEYVLGDSVRLRQILMNLIGNAVKFTDHGEVCLETLPSGDRKGWVRFSVKDTGIGISDADLRNLFQPYTQADASSSRKYGGTGLGLAISHRLVQLLGGNMDVDSREGFGSDFHIVLPLPESEPRPAPEPLPSPAPPTRDEPLSRKFSGKRVLLAEDNAVNRMLALKMLEKTGVQVEVALNGKEAIDGWKTGRFDFIFMDCQMPEMDGYEATRTIRQLERDFEKDLEKDLPDRGHIPIVALTAHAMEEDRRRCLDSGMDDYLSKPVKPEALRQTLERWLGNPRTLASE